MQAIELTKQTKLKLLTYGKPGSGKTTFVASAALDERTAPVLHIDCSGNPQSLIKVPGVASAIADRRLFVVRLDQLAELNPIYDWLLNGQPASGALTTKYGIAGVRTVVFDGITAIQRKSFEVVTGTTAIKPGDVPAKPDYNVYGGVLRQMLKIATAFYQTLPDLHIIMTALEHTDQRFDVPGDNKTIYAYAEPGLSGASGDELPGEALAVLRFAHTSNFPLPVLAQHKAKDAFSLVQFKPTRTAYAKDQHGFGADFATDITVTRLLDALAR